MADEHIVIPDWQIYYSDLSTISSQDINPFAIERRDDIQVIMQKDQDHRWITLCGYDYYMWDIRYAEKARWWGGNRLGLFQYLIRPGFKTVLMGYHIDNQRFGEIFNLARNEFGDKTGYSNNERKP